MGQTVQMRAERRFLDEFARDLSAACPVQAGDKLVVVSVSVGHRSPDGVLAFYATLRDEHGISCDVELIEEPTFDLDLFARRELVESLADYLNLSPEEAQNRLFAGDI